MQIERPVDFTVLQRTGDTAILRAEGTADSDGSVETRLITSSGSAQPWEARGEAVDGRWSIAIPEIPLGGPYQLEVRRGCETARVEQILVGDLWVLAGQSNMQGVGDMKDVETPHPLIHVFEMKETWSLAEEPLHWLLESPCPVYWRGMEEAHQEAISLPRVRPEKGAGLGLAFAKELVEATGIPVGLIPCALGGSAIRQWDPAERVDVSISLYAAMLHRVWLAGGRVAGVLWYQGESECEPEQVAEYPDRLRALVEATRQDFSDANLPWCVVQIARVVMPWSITSWNAIQECLRHTEGAIPRLWMTPAVDLPLDDAIHIGTPGLKRLGRRLANLVRREVHGEIGIKCGPRPVSATIRRGRPDVIYVEYDEVNGGLHPRTHIGGFSLHRADGSAGADVYDASVDPDNPARVMVRATGPAGPDAQVAYGMGGNPYCNLVDELDMAAPAFAPMAILRV